MTARKAAKKKATRPGFRYGLPAERADIMDKIYDGALAIIRKHGGASAEMPDDVVRVRGKSPARTAAAVSGPLADAAKKLAGKGKCEAIRSLALGFPDATVAQIRAAFPDINPSTVAIQVRKARAA
jgi:hypothetical protein